MIMISLSRFTATEKPSLVYIPLEYRLRGVSMKSSSSLKAMIRSILSSTSFLERPRITPLR